MDDTFYPIRIILKVYKTFGLWHEEPYEAQLKIYGVILHTLVTTSFIFAMAMDLVVRGSDNLNGFEVSLVFLEFALFIKVLNIFFANKSLRKILSELDSIEMQPQNIKEHDVYLTSSGMRGVQKTALVYYGMSLFSYGVATVGSFIDKIHGVKKCPHSNWFFGFYCSDGGRAYDFIFLFQAAAMFMHCLINITTDMLIPTVFARLSGGLGIIGHQLEDIQGTLAGNNSEYCLQKLKICIDQHNHIIQLLERFQTSFQYAVFAQTLISSIVICSSAYNISANTPEDLSVLITMITFTVAMITEIGIPCYYGTNLYYENLGLSFKAYCSGWQEISPKFGQYLLRMMIQTGRPIQFKALSLLKLNLDTFLWVLQKSYSLFAVLRNMN